MMNACLLLIRGQLTGAFGGKTAVPMRIDPLSTRVKASISFGFG